MLLISLSHCLSALALCAALCRQLLPSATRQLRCPIGERTSQPTPRFEHQQSGRQWAVPRKVHERATVRLARAFLAPARRACAAPTARNSGTVRSTATPRQRRLLQRRHSLVRHRARERRQRLTHRRLASRPGRRCRHFGPCNPERSASIATTGECPIDCANCDDKAIALCRPARSSSATTAGIVAGRPTSSAASSFRLNDPGRYIDVTSVLSGLFALLTTRHPNQVDDYAVTASRSGISTLFDRAGQIGRLF